MYFQKHINYIVHALLEQKLLEVLFHFKIDKD